MMALLCSADLEEGMKYIRNMIVKWGICPYCKKATEFHANDLRCPGCGNKVSIDEIIEDE